MDPGPKKYLYHSFGAQGQKNPQDSSEKEERPRVLIRRRAVKAIRREKPYALPSDLKNLSYFYVDRPGGVQCHTAIGGLWAGGKQ